MHDERSRLKLMIDIMGFYRRGGFAEFGDEYVETERYVWLPEKSGSQHTTPAWAGG